MKNAKMAVNRNTSTCNLICKKFQSVNSKKVRTSIVYYENTYKTIYTKMASWATELTKLALKWSAQFS